MLQCRQRAVFLSAKDLMFFQCMFTSSDWRLHAGYLFLMFADLTRSLLFRVHALISDGFILYSCFLHACCFFLLTTSPLLQRGEDFVTSCSLIRELRALEQRAAELDQAVAAANLTLKEAEEANGKVVTRVASLLALQAKRDPKRGRQSQLCVNGPLVAGDPLEDCNPHITQEGYESALIQTEELEAQLTAMKKQTERIMQKQDEQEEMHKGKVIECRQAFA